MVMNKAFTTLEAQVERTATEISVKNQATTDTIRLLKQLRIDQWTRIHDKALIIHGLWDGKGERPYTLSLTEEENISKTQQIEEAKMRIENNLSNYVAEIAKINNVNKQEAEAILKENIEINSGVFESTKHMNQEDENYSNNKENK